MRPQSRARKPDRWPRRFVFVGLPVALVCLTAWNVTRSEPHSAAGRQAYSRDHFAAGLTYALAHLDKQPWSREAALLAAKCLSRLNYALEAEPYYRLAGQLDLADLQVRAYGLARQAAAGSGNSGLP